MAEPDREGIPQRDPPGEGGDAPRSAGSTAVGRLRRRFLFLCAVLGWVPAAALLPSLGGRSAAAYLLAFAAVSADFLWMTAGFGALFRPGAAGRGAGGRAMGAMGLRMVLLLIGLYGILHFFPREFLALVLGIGAPLVLFAAAGALPVRG